VAYGRVSGKYRIHLRETTSLRGDDDNWRVAETERIPWSSCSRELKLRTFALLPALLSKISEETQKLTQQTEETSKTVRDILSAIGDPESQAKPSGLPASMLSRILDQGDFDTSKKKLRDAVLPTETLRAAFDNAPRQTKRQSPRPRE
jgi:hypothetical protein